MLVDAFEELASEKSLGDISVSELCERSTVRRNTFYRHFSDKYAFITFYLHSLADRFMAEAEAECDLDKIHEYAQHMHRALIRFLQTHQKIAKFAMGSTGSVTTIDMIIKQIAEGITLRAAQRVECQTRQPEMPVEFLGYFYSAGMVHTLRWWLFEERPVTTAVLERYCTDFLMRCLVGYGEMSSS